MLRTRPLRLPLNRTQHHPLLRHAPRCAASRSGSPSEKPRKTGGMTNIIENVHNLFISPNKVKQRGSGLEDGSTTAGIKVESAHGVQHARVTELEADVRALQHQVQGMAGELQLVKVEAAAWREGAAALLSDLGLHLMELMAQLMHVKSASKDSLSALQELGDGLKSGLQDLHHKVEQLGQQVAAHQAPEPKVDVDGLQREVAALQGLVQQLQVQQEKAALEMEASASLSQEGMIHLGAPVRCLAITPDSHHALWGDSHGNLHAYQLSSRTFAARWAAHSCPTRCVAVTPNGRFAVSGSDDKDLRIWDLRSYRCLSSLKGHSDCVCGVAVTPDGKRVVSASDDATLRVWSLQDHSCLATLRGHKGRVTAVACTPDGRHALSAGADQNLRKWSLDTYACAESAQAETRAIEWARAVAVTPDGRQAVTAGEGLRVWDLESLSCIAKLQDDSQGRGWFNAVAVTPDGRYVVCGGNDHCLHVWDMGSRTHVATLKGHVAPVRSVAVTPDGQWALSGGEDGAVFAWKLWACL